MTDASRDSGIWIHPILKDVSHVNAIRWARRGIWDAIRIRAFASARRTSLAENAINAIQDSLVCPIMKMVACLAIVILAHPMTTIATLPMVNAGANLTWKAVSVTSQGRAITAS